MHRYEYTLLLYVDIFGRKFNFVRWIDTFQPLNLR